MSKKGLPKVLYVYKELDGDDYYFVANETLRDCLDLEDKRLVGTYKLVQSQTIAAEVKVVSN